MTNAVIVALLLPTIWLTIYAVRCAYFPLRRCRKCKGAGRRDRLIRSGQLLCSRCKGTGQSIRWGRVVADRIRTARTRERAVS